MKADPHLEELFRMIKDKHLTSMNASERIIIKWLGWLTYFLSMSRKDRLDFCRDESQVAETTKQLTEDMHELRAQRTTINTR